MWLITAPNGGLQVNTATNTGVTFKVISWPDEWLWILQQILCCIKELINELVSANITGQHSNENRDIPSKQPYSFHFIHYTAELPRRKDKEEILICWHLGVISEKGKRESKLDAMLKHHHEYVWRNVDKTSRILSSALDCGSVVSFMLRPICPRGKSP
jgi:hypothetical protein